MEKLYLIENNIIAIGSHGKQYQLLRIKGSHWLPLSGSKTEVGPTQCSLLCHSQAEDCDAFRYDDEANTCSLGKVMCPVTLFS